MARVGALVVIGEISMRRLRELARLDDWILRTGIKWMVVRKLVAGMRGMQAAIC
jgi:hypothetical protein